MFETIGLLIKWVPTLLFILILFVSFWVGFIRGHRKSAIFLLHSVITGSLLIILYFVILDTNFGDKLLLDVINLFMGEDGLEISLNVSIDCIYFKDVILEYILQMMNLEESINVVLHENIVYLQLLVNLVFHIVLAIAFYIVYLVLLLVLSIIYLLFYSDRIHKKRIAKKFMQGKVPSTFRKKRLAGGLIGLSRGLISGLIAVSMLGSTFYSITGGKGEDNTLVEHDFNETTADAVYSMYRAVENYGDVGIIELFNTIQNKDEVPVYLLLSDAINHGKVVVESEEGNITYNLVLRDELSVYTDVIKGAFNVLVKHFSDEINSLISGDLTFEEFSTEFTTRLSDIKLQSDLSIVIDKLLDADYLSGLAVSLLDSILANIDNFTIIDPNVAEILKVMFKKGYYSEIIPSEKALKTRESNIVLPYISTSYLINKGDLSSILINVLSLMNSEMSEDIFETIKLYVNNFRYLSIFTDETKKERFNQVLARVFLVVENTFLADSFEVQERKLSKRSDTYPEIIQELDPEYYDLVFGKKQISWIDEIDSLLNAYDDIMVLSNNVTSEEGIFDITKIFDNSMETYEDNVSAYERIVQSIQDSRVIARVLKTKAITNVFVESIKGILPSFELMDNIQFENTYDDDGNLVKKGELYYLFKGLRMILDPSKTNIYPLIMGDEFSVETIEELSEELSKKDDEGESLNQYFVEFDFMRSIVSSLLIDKVAADDLLYISYRALESNEKGEPINVIKKDELKPLLNNLTELIRELKPLLEGEDISIDQLINSKTISLLIYNKIVQGTIASQILAFNETSNALVIPQYLKKIDNWIDSENNQSELVKLYDVINGLGISLDFKNADLLQTLKQLSDKELNTLLETEVLYYTISDFLMNNNLGDFSIIVPTEATKTLVNDSIDGLVKKDYLIKLINNINSLNIDGTTDINGLLTNLVKYRELYTDDVILSTSLIKMLVNNFKEQLAFPSTLLDNATDSKLKIYSLSNPWRTELPNLLKALDEIFNVTYENNDIDVSLNLENLLKDLLDQYDQPSNVENDSSKLKIYLDSLVISKSITGVIDQALINDFTIESSKAMAKTNDVYPLSEIKSLLDVMRSYDIDFNNIESFNVNNVLATSTLKNILLNNDNAYLLRGILTKQIESLFTGNQNGLHYHPYAYEEELLKKNEIHSLITLLDGTTFESFNSSSFDFNLIDKYIYNAQGDCDSYILVSSISYSLLNDSTIVVPNSVIDDGYKMSIKADELHKFIIATSDMAGINSLGNISVENMEVNETAFESKIMNATITNHLNIAQNNITKDAYVLSSRVDSDSLFNNPGERVLILKEEEYSSLLRALDILTSHSDNLNINLDIAFLMGLDYDSLYVLLESTLLSMSINELLINSSYKVIIDTLIPNLEKNNVEVYNLTTKAKSMEEVYTNNSIVNIISFIKNL